MPARRDSWLLWLLGLAAVLRLWGLGAASLWFDEATSLAVASAPLLELPRLVSRLEGSPPLHPLLLRTWLPLFDDPRLGMRLLSALCALAACAIFISLCRRLLGARAALPAALGCLSSFWIHHAHDGRGYALFLFFSLAQARLLLALLDRWSARRAAAWGAAAVLGLYTHNFAVFPLLAQALCVAVLEKRERLWRWGALFAAAAALYAPWLPFLRAQTAAWREVTVLQRGLGFSELGSLLGTMVVDTSFLSFAHVEATRLLGWAVLACALAGAVRFKALLASAREATVLCAAHLGAAFLGLWALELALGSSASQARYLVFASPFLFVWLALALGRAGPALIPVFALGTAAYLAGLYAVDPRLEALAQRVRRAAAPGAVVVHLDPGYYTPMRYYYLPELTHKLAGEDRKLNWDALPGYPARLAPGELAALGNCLVLDPQRSLFPGRVGTAAGKDLDRLRR